MPNLSARRAAVLVNLTFFLAPEEMVLARQEYFNRSSQKLMESVDNSFMRNNDARMPLFNERKTSVTRGPGFGNGSK
jgi:hypothetical protein